MRIVVLETLWQLETFAAEEAEVGREITINDLRRGTKIMELWGENNNPFHTAYWKK